MTPEDPALLAWAFDNPVVITVLLELSKDNELAQKAVRWALAYHVCRWDRLTRMAAASSDAPCTPTPPDDAA